MSDRDSPHVVWGSAADSAHFELSGDGVAVLNVGVRMEELARVHVL